MVFPTPAILLATASFSQTIVRPCILAAAVWRRMKLSPVGLSAAPQPTNSPDSVTVVSNVIADESSRLSLSVCTDKFDYEADQLRVL